MMNRTKEDNMPGESQHAELWFSQNFFRED